MPRALEHSSRPYEPTWDLLGRGATLHARLGVDIHIPDEYGDDRINSCVLSASLSLSRYTRRPPRGASSSTVPAGGASARHLAGCTAVAGGFSSHLCGSSSSRTVEVTPQHGHLRHTAWRSFISNGLVRACSIASSVVPVTTRALVFLFASPQEASPAEKCAVSSPLASPRVCSRALPTR